METMKVSFELTSPVTGKIVEVNEGLKDSPELVNSDPYSAGWLLEIRATNLEGDRKRLLTAEEYFELMKEKVDEESSRMGKE
jgi:glycine cleavage system H protein